MMTHFVPSNIQNDQQWDDLSWSQQPQHLPKRPKYIHLPIMSPLKQQQQQKKAWFPWIPIHIKRIFSSTKKTKHTTQLSHMVCKPCKTRTYPPWNQQPNSTWKLMGFQSFLAVGIEGRYSPRILGKTLMFRGTQVFQFGHPRAIALRKAALVFSKDISKINWNWFIPTGTSWYIPTINIYI